MAADASTVTTAGPFINVQFVKSDGTLTQSAYALLSGLVRRTGGSQAPAIDIPNIDAAFADLNAQLQAFDVRVDAVEDETDSLLILPAPADHAPPIEQPDGRLQQLEAQVQALTQQVNALLLR